MLAFVAMVAGWQAPPPKSHPPSTSTPAGAAANRPLVQPEPRQLLRSDAPVMPVGVPNRAYKTPEGTIADWVESYNKLYQERIIYLGQEIDDYVCNQIISVMLFADSEVDNKPLYLYINSPGGSVIAGLALYDTMQHISSPVITCNTGMAASMASFILGAGERGKRIALPGSRVMIHQPMGGSEGQAEDVRVEAEQILKIKGTLITMYSHMTGQTREQIEKDLGHDNYMSSQQALEYGLIDKIVTSVDGP